MERKNRFRRLVDGQRKIDQMKNEIVWTVKAMRGFLQLTHPLGCAINFDAPAGREYIWHLIVDQGIRIRLIEVSNTIPPAYFDSDHPDSLKLEHVNLVHENLNILVETLPQMFPAIRDLPEWKALLEAGAD